MEPSREGGRAPEPSGLGVAWQAAHLVSGPLNLYRHYEVSIVDWLKGRKIPQVSSGKEARSLGHTPKCAAATAPPPGRDGEEQSLETPGSSSPQERMP